MMEDCYGFTVRPMGERISPKMPAKPSKRKVLGLRVSSDSNQGGRDHMEDMIAIRYERGAEHDCAFLGIFDGHGGKEAAVYARDLLWDNIKSQRGFDSKDPEKVKQAISDGFMKTQEGMWKRRGSWRTTKSGYPSTSGTTACIAIIRQGQLWVAHVGDSRAVMGVWTPQRGLQPCTVTDDHKPESPREMERIQALGGQVQAKNGVQRVVWQRTRLDHTGPVRRSTNVDQIPFLAVARSLGDLWSYSTLHNDYVVSPKPDISYRVLNPKVHQCLVMGTDGLWNMVSSSDSIYILSKYNTEKRSGAKMRETMAQRLVKNAINRWVCRSLRADNTTAITIVFDFPKEKPQPAKDTDKTAEQSSADGSASEVAKDEKEHDSSATVNGKEVESVLPDSPKSLEGGKAEEAAGTKLVIRGETDFVGVQGFGTVRPKLRHSNMYRDFVFRFHYPEPLPEEERWGWRATWMKRQHEQEEEEPEPESYTSGWGANPWKPDGERYINTPVVEVTNKKIHRHRPSSDLEVSPWASRQGLAPKTCDCFSCHNNLSGYCMRKPINANGESAIQRHNIQIVREYKMKKKQRGKGGKGCRCYECARGHPEGCTADSSPPRGRAKRRRVSSPEFRQSRYNTRSSPTEPDLPLAQRALRSLNKAAAQSPRARNLTTPKKRLTRRRRAPIKSC